MKGRVIPFLAVSLLLLSAALVPARVDEQEAKAENARSIAAEPIQRPRNGKNVALRLELKSNRRLPRGVAIGINGRQVSLLDDGNWPDITAGDGIYSAAAKTADGKPLKEKSVLRLNPGAKSEHHASSPALSCTFKRVECPVNCKSIIFNSKCVICFELQDCTLEF